MLTGVLIGLVVGFLAGVFVYRNNTKKLAAIADKVDLVYDKVESKIEENK